MREVPGNLNLDVTHLREIFLNKEMAITEGGLNLTLRGLEGGNELFRPLYNLHSASTTSGARLEKDWIASFIRDLQRLSGVEQSLTVTWNSWNAHLVRHTTRASLVAHDTHATNGWSDERDATARADLSERGIFTQESVPRVNRVGACRHSRRHN